MEVMMVVDEVDGAVRWFMVEEVLIGGGRWWC